MMATHPPLAICGPDLHAHEPPQPRCEGCGVACGPDDILPTSTGTHPICPTCWGRWRDGRYTRVVRRAIPSTTTKEA